MALKQRHLPVICVVVLIILLLPPLPREGEGEGLVLFPRLPAPGFRQGALKKKTTDAYVVGWFLRAQKGTRARQIFV
jgi:hypothetical protein